MVDTPNAAAPRPALAQGDTEDRPKPVPKINKIKDNAAAAAAPATMADHDTGLPESALEAKEVSVWLADERRPPLACTGSSAMLVAEAAAEWGNAMVSISGNDEYPDHQTPMSNGSWEQASNACRSKRISLY